MSSLGTRRRAIWCFSSAWPCKQAANEVFPASNTAPGSSLSDTPPSSITAVTDALGIAELQSQHCRRDQCHEQPCLARPQDLLVRHFLLQGSISHQSNAPPAPVSPHVPVIPGQVRDSELPLQGDSKFSSLVWLKNPLRGGRWATTVRRNTAKRNILRGWERGNTPRRSASSECASESWRGTVLPPHKTLR